MIGCVTDLGTEMHGRVDGWINEWMDGHTDKWRS